MPTPKKVLIITYYWPPGGGIAVQRWLKFAKYLPGYDWQPIIYTVSNGEYNLIDTNLATEISKDLQVIRRPIWEPYQLYRLFGKGKMGSGQLSIKPGAQAGWTEKLSLWVRSNIFIPDARCFWIRPSIRFLTRHLKENKVDAIISTGPPHSLHLIGMEVSARTGIPWLADFRDPWTSMDYYQDLILTKHADEKHHRLEREVLTRANAVVVVGKMMQREFEEKRGGPVAYVPNGYDAEAFVRKETSLDHDFTLVHAGSLLARRNPVSLWRALTELQAERHPLLEKLKIKLLGRVDEAVLRAIEERDLQKFVQVIPFIPHHELIDHLKSAGILFLPIDYFDGAQWVLTGKLFEYMAAGRPVLCIGPLQGDAAAVIRETRIGEIFDFEDVAGIKKYLGNAFEKYKLNTLKLQDSQIAPYSIVGLTQKIADILNKI